MLKQTRRFSDVPYVSVATVHEALALIETSHGTTTVCNLAVVGRCTWPQVFEIDAAITAHCPSWSFVDVRGHVREMGNCAA